MFAVCVLLGSYTVTIPDFFRILAAHLTGGEKIPGASFIVMENKLPRAVIGTLIGVAFGLSGGLFQTMLRNPLASPDVIGISYGASAAAVTAIVVFGASGAAVSGAALGGALGVAAVIYAISRGGSLGSGGGNGGNAAGSRLILAGVGIAAALHAVVNFLMTRADIRTAADALVWLNGSLNSANWDRAGRPRHWRCWSWSRPSSPSPARCASWNSATTPPPDWASASASPGWPWWSPPSALAAVATAAAGPGGVRRLPRRSHRAPLHPQGQPAGVGLCRCPDCPGGRLLRRQHRPLAAGRHRAARRRDHRRARCPVPAVAPGHGQPKGCLTWQFSAPQDLTLKYDQRCVVEGLTAEIPEGKVTMIVGANACGKSTLLRGLSRLLKPAGRRRDPGRQGHPLPPGPRTGPHPGPAPAAPHRPGRHHRPRPGGTRPLSAPGLLPQLERRTTTRAVQRALEATETLELADRNVDELSGGQRQRVWIAMALAQETDVLLLDEPTTYLDLAHQVEVLDLVTDLNRKRGTTVAIVLHDLNLAARYADHVIAMKAGGHRGRRRPQGSCHRGAGPRRLRPGVQGHSRPRFRNPADHPDRPPPHRPSQPELELVS